MAYQRYQNILKIIFKIFENIIFKANGSTHAELCTSVGLEPLRLSSDEEQEYFLNVIRNTQTTLHTHIGADKMGEDWIWQGTRERIHYPVRWYPSYPNSNAAWTCLMVANYWATKANTAFFNHPCDHIYPYICQKTGNLN